MREQRAREVFGGHYGDEPTARYVRLVQDDRTKVGPTRGQHTARRTHSSARLSSWGLSILGALQGRPMYQGTSVKARNTRKHARKGAE